MPVAISEHSGRSEVGDGAGMEREGARRGSVERQLAGAVWGRGETIGRRESETYGSSTSS